MERIFGLDREIKELVGVLNRHGFKTYYSCAGHAPYAGYEGHAPYYRGCIQLLRINHEPLRAILEWYGLKDIKIRDLSRVSPYGQDQGIPKGTKVTETRFAPIGLTVKQRVAQMNHKRIPRES
ncbi:hypothetical protein ES703_71431 [subsurface metagenome]